MKFIVIVCLLQCTFCLKASLKPKRKSRERRNEDILEGDSSDDEIYLNLLKRSVRSADVGVSKTTTTPVSSTTDVWSVEDELNQARCRLPCMKFYPNLTSSWAFGYDPDNRHPVLDLPETEKGRVKREDNTTIREEKQYLCYGGACLIKEADYDIFSLPGQEESTAEEVYNPIYVGMLISFIDVEEHNQELKMDFELEVEWEDNRLELCICEDDNIDRYAIFPRNLVRRIFTPDIVFMDAVLPEEVNDMRNNYGMWVSQLHGDHGVSIMWKLKMTVTFVCHLNFEWYPWDVNACPIIITSDFNNYNIMNIIMNNLPDIGHVSNNIRWNFNIEPLVSDKEAKFAAFSSHGVSDTQRYTGFRVLIMRKLVPPQIYIDFLHLMVVWMGFITLLPLYKDRLATLGTFLIAMGEMFTELLKDIPERNHKEIKVVIN